MMTILPCPYCRLARWQGGGGASKGITTVGAAGGRAFSATAPAKKGVGGVRVIVVELLGSSSTMVAYKGIVDMDRLRLHGTTVENEIVDGDRDDDKNDDDGAVGTLYDIRCSENGETPFSRLDPIRSEVQTRDEDVRKAGLLEADWRIIILL